MSKLNPDLFNNEEAAEFIGVKPQTLAVWRMSGKYSLPYTKVGKLIRYRRKDLEAWLESRSVLAPVSSR